MVELSKAQDIEAGDGTTSVVVIAGSLLEAAERLLQKGIHPTLISDAFQKAAAKAVQILAYMSISVDLRDKQSLIRAAATSLNSKVYITLNDLTRLNSLSVFVCNVHFIFFLGCLSTVESVSSFSCGCSIKSYSRWKR